VARQRSGFRHPRAPRRQTEWDEGPGGEAVTTIVGNILQILGAGVEALETLTVTRIRGLLTCDLSIVGGANEGFQLTYGIGIVSSDAFAVGATAVPNPQEDMDWGGWMTHGFMNIVSPVATLSQASSQVKRVQAVIDVKAMRKMSPNETLFMVVDTLETGTATMKVFFDSRILVKLF